MGNEKKGSGCLKAVLIVFIIIVIIVLAAAVGVFGAAIYTKHKLNSYMSNEPMKIEQAPLDKKTEQNIDEKITDLNKSIEKHNSITLELDSEELSQMIAKTADAAGFSDIAKIWIEDDSMNAEMSVPLPDKGTGKTRYLNGKFTFSGSVKNGRLNVNVTRCVLGGKVIPSFLLGIINANDWGQLMEEKYGTEWLDGIDTVEISNGKLIIKTK